MLPLHYCLSCPTLGNMLYGMASPLKFPYRYRVMILLYFLTLITYLDRVTISLVGVRIKTALHLSNVQFGWVLGAFAMSVIFGKIVDLTHSFDSPQFVMVGVLIVGGLCWLLIDASKKIILVPNPPSSYQSLPMG